MISMALIIVTKRRISTALILKSVLPITFGTYWYITAYAGLFLLIPWINIVIRNTDSYKIRILIFILLIITSFIPTFLRQRYWTSDLVWFITLYLIGAYINRHHVYNSRSHKIWVCLSILSVLIIWGLSVAILILSTARPGLEKYINVFSMSNYSSFAFLASIFIFLSFLSMKPFFNARVNKIAKRTLGIYLIQSSPFVGDVLWKFLKSTRVYYFRFWSVIAIGITLLIYICSYLLESIRYSVVKKTLIEERLSIMVYDVLNNIRRLILS